MRLVVFDLDDTLVDTSGSVLPAQIRKVSMTLFARGVIRSVEDSEQELWGCDRSSLNSRLGLKKYLTSIRRFEFLDEMCAILYDLPDPAVQICAAPGALDVVQALRNSGKRLAIATRGDVEKQRLKLERSGLSCDLFDTIKSCMDLEEKDGIYREILMQFGCSPKEAIVCGDRISVDHIPARRVGIKTVHIRQGRGKESVCSEGDVDHRIDCLRELLPLLGVNL